MAHACVGGPCWPVQPEDRGDRNGRVQGLVQNHAHPVSADPVYTTLPDSGELLRLTSDSYGELFTSDTTAYRRNGQDRTRPNISGRPGLQGAKQHFRGCSRKLCAPSSIAFTIFLFLLDGALVGAKKNLTIFFMHVLPARLNLRSFKFPTILSLLPLLALWVNLEGSRAPHSLF
jgi:hypothetical protein